ncbi:MULTISPECIES: hypothetical protein [unclassified Mesorhizobium]|nr:MULTISPECIES: hypothetical protein [unclassified Mesorhizobium]
MQNFTDRFFVLTGGRRLHELGYELIELPLASVEARMRFILAKAGLK